MIDTTLAIRRITTSNLSPVKQAIRCFQAKDVTAAYPTSQCAEAPSENNKHYFIHFTGLDYNIVKNINREQMEVDPLNVIDPVIAFNRASQYYFDWDLLTQVEKDSLFANREITLDWPTHRDKLIDKLTGLPALNPNS